MSLLCPSASAASARLTPTRPSDRTPGSRDWAKEKKKNKKKKGKPNNKLQSLGKVEYRAVCKDCTWLQGLKNVLLNRDVWFEQEGGMKVMYFVLVFKRNEPIERAFEKVTGI
jgi:hypothetical protein